MKDRHLLSVDELRAAGALDVPPEWRKSLSAGKKPVVVERDLFSDLTDDDDTPPEAPSSVPGDPEKDVSGEPS